MLRRVESLKAGQDFKYGAMPSWTEGFHHVLVLLPVAVPNHQVLPLDKQWCHDDGNSWAAWEDNRL